MPEPHRPIDPDVKKPAAVLRAAAQSKAAFDAVNGIVPANPPTEPVQGQNGNGGQPPTPQADPPPAASAGDPTPSPQATPPVTPQGNQPPPADDWQHRYNSLRGRHDQAQRQLAEQGQRIAALEKLLATQPATPPASVSPELHPQRLLTPQEEQDFGPEFLGVVGKKAKEELLPEITTLKKTVQTLQEQLNGVGQVVVRSARERMFDTLNDNIPNWREINTNPKFLDWLGLQDPYSGVIRQQLLNAAFERNDTERVQRFFQGFLAEEAATDPARSGPGNGTTPAPAAPSRKTPLETFAAPGRAKPAAATAPAEKPVITRAQIQQFYRDVQNGKYRGREAEKDKLEAQIFAAEKDGRIQ